MARDPIEDASISDGTKVDAAEERRRKLEVPFPPLADQGAFFRFNLAAQGKVEEALNEFAPDWKIHREGTFFAWIERHAMGGTPAIVRALIDHGLKRKDEQGRNVPFPVDLDDIPWTTAEIVEPALSAFAVAMTGKTYPELLQEATAAAHAHHGPLASVEGDAA